MFKRIKIIVGLLLCILLFGSMVSPVFAVEKEYTIDSASFSIDIDEQGDAYVSEHWTVNYKKGAFSRFYKNIYLQVPNDEKFQIEFTSILVDGRECTYTNDTNERIDYTYSIVETSNTIRYEIYMNSEDVVREFTVNYVLSDVVKNVNNEYYLFKFRLLPQGFQETIKRTNVSVTLPDDNFEILDSNINQGSAYIEDGILISSDNNVNDLYKVGITFDGNMKDSVYISSTNSNTATNIITVLDDFPTLFMFATTLLFFASICAVAQEIKKNKELHAMLQNNPYLMDTLYKKWVPTYFTPAEFSCYLTKNYCLNYLICLAELTHSGIVQFDATFQFVYYSRRADTSNPIIAILEKCRKYGERKHMLSWQDNMDLDYWRLPVHCIKKGFNKYYNDISKIIRRNTDIMTRKMIKNKRLYKEFNKDIGLMKAIARYHAKYNKATTVELSDVILHYFDPSPYIPYYCFQPMKRNNIQYDNSYVLTDIAMEIYRAHIGSSDNTSSSGSSCSSCGGCSGCGGCGGSD